MRTYEGKGTLSFLRVNDIKGSFQLVFQEDGNIKLVFYPEGMLPNEVLNFSVDSGSFSGESVNSDYKVYVDKIYVKKIHLSSVDDINMEFFVFNPVEIVYQVLEKDDRIILIQGFSNLLF